MNQLQLTSRMRRLSHHLLVRNFFLVANPNLSSFYSFDHVLTQKYDPRIPEGKLSTLHLVVLTLELVVHGFRTSWVTYWLFLSMTIFKNF
jgi:hypothetical protein